MAQAMAETIGYVRHHVRAAGYNAGPLFTDEAFSLVYELSDGIPRDVVRVCSLAIDNLLATDQEQVNLDVIKQVQEQFERRAE